MTSLDTLHKRRRKRLVTEIARCHEDIATLRAIIVRKEERLAETISDIAEAEKEESHAPK